MRNNSYIIQTKNNSLISKSSSGGMFAELAKYILSQNGVVFGCTMERVEEGFEVKHIYIEKEENLYKLQGSKYVQSNLGNTIKQAKEFLDQGRFVLFSGTPCQIAGLKAYLGKDYDNLLTVDLSCEGTPSIETFNKYIKYLEENVIKSKIIDFKFRSKKHFGWSTSGFIAIYKKNGKIKEKILPQNLSSYFTYFLNGNILQERCFSCKYTGTKKRVGDITIADAWGVDKEYPELLKTKFSKNKGVSLVLINTSKGLSIFNEINANLICKKIDVNNLRKYNHPLRHPSIKPAKYEYYQNIVKNQDYKNLDKIFKEELGKKYYYYSLKNHTPKFIKNIIKLFIKQNKKVDCLLMTLYCLSNYGSLLTAYSLQKTINNFGYSTKLIHYGNIYGYGTNFIKKHLTLTKRCLNNKDFANLNKFSNNFILGSDNLINLVTNKLGFVAINLLNFTDINKKRLMISGSIGSWDGSTKTQEEHNYIKQLLARFDYLSTREEHGKDVFKNTFDCEADWINDPVFYLEKEDYLELIKGVKEDYNNKIMQYVLYPTEKTNKIVKYFKEKNNKEIIKFDGNDNVKFFSRHKGKLVENWLSAIINSNLIITDSFHCVAFSLIFNKPFVCIKNTHATVRFTSLFKRLGINIPLIENIEDLERVSLDYDKKQVNDQLSNIREFALSKIEEALLKPKVLTNEQIEQEKVFQQLNIKFIKNSTPWYKKNKLFYLGIIVPFVIPFIRIKRDLKNKNAKIS